jgi:hypothetical protein
MAIRYCPLAAESEVLMPENLTDKRLAEMAAWNEVVFNGYALSLWPEDAK